MSVAEEYPEPEPVARWLPTGLILDDDLPPYRDRDWLYAEYIIEKREVVHIAEESGVTIGTIYNWLRKLDIACVNKRDRGKLKVCRACKELLPTADFRRLL